MSSVTGPSRPTAPNPFEAVVRGQEFRRSAEYDNTIARANIDEINALRGRWWGDPDDDRPLSDRELAFKLAAEEALSFATTQKDRALAVRLSTIDIEDDDVEDDDFDVAALLATQDVAVDQNRAGPNVRTRASGAHSLDYIRTPRSPNATAPNSSSIAQRESVPPVARARPTGHNCVICTDPIYGIEIRAHCGDYYDKACMLELFEAATKDESLFPPRCCRQEIMLADVSPYMTSDLLRRFNEKMKEFSTLKRVYCANPSCSRFLGEQIESSFWYFFTPTYKCPESGCGTQTCTRCKAKFTRMHSCNNDEKDREVLDLGRTEGWARCPGCEQLIELNHGCFHMTCRCKTEFCYVCRAKWKTCGCPQWDERRLLAAAEARADAELGIAAVPPRPAPPRPHAARAAAPLPVPPRRAAAPPPVPPPARPARPDPEQARRAFAARFVPAGHAPAAPPVPVPVVRPAPVPLANTVTATPRATNVRATAHAVPRAQPAVIANPIVEETGHRAQRVQEHNLAVVDWLSALRTARPVRRTATQISGTSSTVSTEAHLTTNVASSTASRAAVVYSALTPRSVLTRRQSIPSPQVERTVPIASTSSTAAKATNRPTSGIADRESTKLRKQPPTQLATLSTMKKTDATRRETLVRVWMDRLRVDHDCHHEGWKYRRGGGRCESCHHDLPFYLFQCNGCAMLACNRCRRNRL
ncbi:uncharacterized protein LAESUDRAFT_721807 [Laetiporus sulphureus 93-53]|uniref:RBR-type E3 ubiquitin transferase n=1 Tax=Laetiporus sulphureus 93-53 TaxID=1314785 RepID=A0A165GJR0_9APHY|nr:uncharacterized protein LAESUDRAFT_721807 [Laetiporus sulphureus 93-53]KZT10448.1 hypothetical protein LAESUDRAFT_721807 [Laetiporus sulphureus 93-53]